MRKTIFFFFISIIAISCNTTMETSEFSIYIPSNLKETTEILDNTELQYATNDLYVAVEKVENTTSIDSFCNENIYSLFDYINKIDSTTIRTHFGHGKKIYFNEGVYSDKYDWMVKILPKDNLYFVLWVWTPEIEFKKNSSSMKKIIKSFNLK